MSMRQLAILVIAFGALLLLWGGAALVRNRETASGGGIPLQSVPRPDVDTVRIIRGRDTTLLARQDSAAWTVNGHPASATVVDELLAALADSARSSEVVAERPGSHAGLGVDSSGSRMTISGRRGPIADLVLGHRSPDLDGGYVRIASDSVVWLVRGGLAAAAERSQDEWRDKSVGGVPADSVATIEVARGRRAYTLRRGKDGWMLAGGGAADSAAARTLVEALGDIQVAGFATPAQADSARFSPPDRRLRVLGANGKPLLVLVFDSMPGGFWVRADDGKEVYRVERWNADRITPADSSLRKR
jgi:hypothetical protein